MVLLGGSLGLLLAGLAYLPSTTSLSETGGGCSELVVKSDVAFVLIGLAFVALFAESIRQLTTRGGGAGFLSLVAPPTFTLAMAVLAEIATPAGPFFFLFCLMGIVVILPLAWFGLARPWRARDPQLRSIAFLMGLALAYPLLVYVASPHPIGAC